MFLYLGVPPIFNVLYMWWGKGPTPSIGMCVYSCPRTDEKITLSPFACLHIFSQKPMDYKCVGLFSTLILPIYLCITVLMAEPQALDYYSSMWVVKSRCASLWLWSLRLFSYFQSLKFPYEFTIRLLISTTKSTGNFLIEIVLHL